jgi:hypothetical protein
MVDSELLYHPLRVVPIREIKRLLISVVLICTYALPFNISIILLCKKIKGLSKSTRVKNMAKPADDAPLYSRS